ncbi:HAMP domain-containing protein [bacterium]|nr:HAMP domain-containing protein [bacterium]
MQKLSVKLTGAFAAVIVVGIVVTVLLARQATATQASYVMIGTHALQPSDLQQDLVDYYAQSGDWEGLDRSLAQLVIGASNHGMMRGMMRGMMGQMMGITNGSVLILDADGAPVAGLGDLSRQATAELTGDDSYPIRVSGERVGTLVLEGTPVTGLTGDALVAAVTRSVLTAALVAAAVAFALGTLLIRQITRPLAALNEASQQIATGKRDIQVTVHSRDELGQLGQTFNQMVSSLQTQETLRRNLMADVAHELRTPLSGIQGTVEAMQDGVFALTPDNLDAIHEQVLLLNRLVEDLRTLANAEAGQLSLHREAVDLAQVAARQRTIQIPHFQQKGVALTVSAPANLPAVDGDEERLGQVLGNLLANALRHTPSGGHVDVQLSAADGQIHLAVLDDGEGIAPEDLPHVFDRFYRGDRSRSRQTGGSGLGLAIVRQLVEAHGGAIRVKSPPPGQAQGTGIFVFLRRCE